MTGRNFTRTQAENFFRELRKDDQYTQYRIINVSLLETLPPFWIIDFECTSKRELADNQAPRTYTDNLLITQSFNHATGEVQLRLPLPCPLPRECNTVAEEDERIENEIREYHKKHDL